MNASERFIRIQKMLEEEPDDLFLNYSLAIEYISSGQVEEAVQSFLKVISLKTDYVPSYYQLGKIYEGNSENEKALQYFRKGLEFARAQKNNKAINEFGEAIFMLED
jgi:tetratricopeptide (TPR) repeat protein